MNSLIVHRQNEPDSITLLRAKTHLFSVAKWIKLIRVLVSLGFAAAGVLLPTGKEYVVFFSACWLSFDQLVLLGLETQSIASAAAVQEQFDTYVLSLPTNSRIQLLKPEDIAAAAERFVGSVKSLTDWYTDPGPLPGRLPTLLCLRTNLTWDTYLRRLYGNVLLGITWVAIICFAFWGIRTQQKLNDLLLSAAPGVNIVVQTFASARGHLRIAREKDAAEKMVRSLWRQGLERNGAVDSGKLRDIQDDLYDSRKTGPLVPDIIHRLFRAQQTRRTEQAIKQFQKEAAAAAQSNGNAAM